ncbi:MAG: ribosomal L7Ae/L30e/S12e/Gadd45 family protein [Oscillospiraceae bacterium]|jgi:ribosomal protein L7Ae-like RNA K-turn-binding protein|nr:ribosomal L7Ae/L30e/S12e/Gadd45 family protein [Oscillospiraceae bacterium]
MNKLLFALSLAKKSGKLVMGFDAVKTAVIHGTAHIVLLAEDLSEKTVKRVNYFCEDLTEVHNTGLTQFEISQVAGRLTGVLAVTDENLAVLARNALQ